MPGALVIQTRSSLWYLQSRLKLQGEITEEEYGRSSSEKVREFQKAEAFIEGKNKNQGWRTALLLPTVVAGLLHSCSTGRTAGLLHIEPVWLLPTVGGVTVIDTTISFAVLSMNTIKKRDFKALFCSSRLPCPVCGCWLNIRRERGSLKKKKTMMKYRTCHCHNNNQAS